MDAATPLLDVSGLSVSFGEVRANEDVSLQVWPGEIHCVLGENGAGKSTLMKLLYGVYQPDAGEIRWQGEPVRIDSPLAARRLGLAMVFQDFRLVPALTVLENVILAQGDRGPRLQRREYAERLAEVARALDLDVDLDAPVRSLAIAQQQQVEIAKVLVGGARILILDEPTSVLAPQEADGLFARLEELRGRGLAILMITHKLRETRQVADRLTVLRGGRSVLVGADPAGIDDDALVEAMVGRKVPPLPSSRAASARRGPVLEVRGLCVAGDGGRAGLTDVHLSVDAGEIVGVAGVAGSGQRELADALAGARSWSAGEIVVAGAGIGDADPVAALSAGVATVPEDPVREWVVPGLSIVEHIGLREMWRRRVARWLGMDWRSVREAAAALDAEAELEMAALDRHVATLSGGNIQRVVLTQVLGAPAEAFVLSYPTRGLDVASCRQVYELMLRQRERGAAIVFLSEDIDELLQVADRIVVLHAGRLEHVDAGRADRNEIGRLMLGAAA